MSRRIEVELTSRRDDGTWTWRAAGAREPKGLVDAALLPAESKVGDNLRVEIEQFIDGIGILSVLPSRSARTEPQRLELLGPRTPERLVTTTVSPRGRRDDRDRPRRPRDEAGGDRRGERRDGGRRPDGDGRPRRPGGEGGEGRERRERPAFAGGGGGRGGGGDRSPVEAKPRPKRIRPGRTHRRELIAGLPEEQRPIAEELSKGGIPGVRAALEAQNAQARSEGQPEISPEPLLALAEELWPRMRTAEWHDRAEAALKDVDELDLRDLRSVVVAADSGARDDDTRALAAQLRDALTRRVDEEHLKWLTELAELVAESRIVAALRRSSRPPKAGAPLPSDLARLLIDRTSEALNAEVGADRWSVLLDALSFSPVRSSVTPAAVPDKPSEELLAAVRRSASRLPHIAALFGVEAPAAPPPTSRGGGRRSGGRSGGRSDRGGAGRGSPAAREPEAPPTAETEAEAPAANAAEPVADAAEPVADASEPAADAAEVTAAAESASEAPAPAETADPAADAAAGEPSEPAAERPSEPAAERPSEAAAEQPAVPAAEQPSEAAAEQPVVPAVEAAAESASERNAPAEPPEPVVAEPAELVVAESTEAPAERRAEPAAEAAAEPGAAGTGEPVAGDIPAGVEDAAAPGGEPAGGADGDADPDEPPGEEPATEEPATEEPLPVAAAGWASDEGRRTTAEDSER